MDPNATWRELIDAHAIQDGERVEELAQALISWLDRGGFPPTIADRQLPTEAAAAFVKAVCLHLLEADR